MTPPQGAGSQAKAVKQTEKQDREEVRAAQEAHRWPGVVRLERSTKIKQAAVKGGVSVSSTDANV